VTAALCPRCGAALAAQAFEVRDVGIVLAGDWDEPTGLLAWATVTVGPIQLAGLTVRRRHGDDLTVTFPARKDRRGSLHREITVLDGELDRRIRAAVVAAYVNGRGKAGRRPL
jgi:hypothetical protein